MSDFVAECRREWKRLRVPDPVADEMAADLAADLSEAAAEGVPAEEVLGAGARDPRSFAASWAAERGVADPRSRKRTGTGVLALAAAILFLATIAAGAALLATPSTTSALPAPPDPAAWQAWNVDTNGGTRKVERTVSWIDEGDPSIHTATVAIKADALAPWVEPVRPSGQGSNTDAVAWVLLVTGIVGLVLTTLAWWRARARRPARPLDADGHAASYA